MESERTLPTIINHRYDGIEFINLQNDINGPLMENARISHEKKIIVKRRNEPNTRSLNPPPADLQQIAGAQ
jgi:hypothetical protein